MDAEATALMDGPPLVRWVAGVRAAVILKACWIGEQQCLTCRLAAIAPLSTMVAKTMTPPATFNFHQLNRNINSVNIFNIKFFPVSSNKFRQLTRSRPRSPYR
jgi:hypothetical protein